MNKKKRGATCFTWNVEAPTEGETRETRGRKISKAPLYYTALPPALFSPSGGKLKEEQEEKEEEKRGGDRTDQQQQQHTWGCLLVCLQATKKKKKRSFFFVFHVTTVSFTIKTLRAQLDKRLRVSPGQVFRISLFLLLVFSCPWWAEKGREREK